METANERTSRIMRNVFKELNYNNVAKFAQDIETNYMQVWYTYNGKNTVLSQDLISKIMSKFPLVNRSYLETGKGSVLLNGNQDGDNEVNKNILVSNNDVFTLLDKVATLLDKINAREASLSEREKKLEEREIRIDNLLAILVDKIGGKVQNH